MYIMVEVCHWLIVGIASALSRMKRMTAAQSVRLVMHAVAERSEVCHAKFAINTSKKDGTHVADIS